MVLPTVLASAGAWAFSVVRSWRKLAGLDPAVRQIEQTRLLAERMIYYLQRVPYVVSLQVDRMTSDLLVRPEVRDLLADTDRVSHSVERFAGVAEDLPATF